MDIAVKQRILGGVVLVAGAILFLPMLLEGAGVQALQPPAIPTAPTTPTTAQLAPPLQKQAADLEQGISASHGEPTFYPVQAPQVAVTAPTPAVQEQFHVVTPPSGKAAEPVASTGEDADAVPVAAVAVPVVAAAAMHMSGDAEDKQARAVSKQAAADKLSEKKALDAKTAQEKKQAEKVARKEAAETKSEQAKKLAEQKQAEHKLAVEKASEKATAKANEKSNDKKATEAAANAADKSGSDADPSLPKAWVVQVAVLSSKDSAQVLQQKLKSKGFRAVVTGKEGAWHVTIAPELDKSVAESIKKRLDGDSELKTKAWVQAYRP